VLGENRKFVCALIVPSFVNLRDWGTKNNIPDSSNEVLIDHPEVQELIEKEIEERNKGLNHVEQIKKFTLLPAEWSIQADELTPTMKVKRKIFMRNSKNIID